MKIFKFPASHIAINDSIKTAKINHHQKQPNSKSPKLSHFKKASSFDLSYFKDKKTKQLQRVYRVNSSDKKFRHHSTHSSKSYNQFKMNAKPVKSSAIFSKKPTFSKDKKIVLQTDKKGKYSINQLNTCLQFISQRLIKCLQLKSQKNFIQNYTETINMLDKFDQKQNDNQILTNLISLIRKCQNKKWEKKLQTLHERNSLLEKQKSSLNIDNKKFKIKQQSLNEQIKKLTDKYMQVAKQLKKLREKKISNQQTQTEIKSTTIQTNVSSDIQKQFPKLIKELRTLKQRQGHMNILMSQLKRDGINLQRVYKRAVKYKIKVQNQEQQDQSQQTSQYPIQVYQKYKQNKERIKQSFSAKETKIKHKYEECDADDSIIDQMDALSFNYKDKQNSMEAYTPRNVYICQKPINNELKKQLQLNFDCLYEQAEDINQNQQQAFPTI